MFYVARLVMEDSVSLAGDEPAPFIVAAPVVLFVTGLVIPLATGLLTKWTLAGWVKGLITTALNAVVAGIAVATRSDGTAVISVEWLFSTAWGIVWSLIAYAKVYLPARLTSSTLDGRLAPAKGIGPTPPIGQPEL